MSETLTFFQLQERLKEMNPSGSDDTNIVSVSGSGTRIFFEANADPEEIRELESKIDDLERANRYADQELEAAQDKVEKLRDELKALKEPKPATIGLASKL